MTTDENKVVVDTKAMRCNANKDAFERQAKEADLNNTAQTRERYENETKANLKQASTRRRSSLKTVNLTTFPRC